MFLFRAWDWPAPFALTVLLGSGIVAALAVVLLTNGYKRGEAAVIAPFEYSGMLWAAFWGLLVFGERPQPLTFFGMVLIALAGWLALRAGRRPKHPI